MCLSMQYPRCYRQRQPHDFAFDVVEVALPFKPELLERLKDLCPQPLLFYIDLLLDGLACFAMTLLARRGYSLRRGGSFRLQKLLEFGRP